MGHGTQIGPSSGPEGILFALDVELVFTLRDLQHWLHPFHCQVTIGQNERQGAEDQRLCETTLSLTHSSLSHKHPGVQRSSNSTGHKGGLPVLQNCHM